MSAGAATRTGLDTARGTRLVPAEEHLAVTVEVLEALGAPARTAREQAELLLEADLRGHASHGLRRLDVLVQRVHNGVADLQAEPTLRWVTDGVLLVDGHGGLGPPTARRAVEALLDRVGRCGVAVAAIRGANHLGMLAPYVEMIAAAGAIGIGMTTSEALVHPWGGSVAMVGTNPLAIAVPTGAEPFVLDMATGQISRGKVLDHATRGVPLADGDAVDAHGVPTTDARAAVDGAISPFGGPKGYALGVALEVLVASLTGSALGRDVRGTLDVTDECNKGDVLVALDLATFGGGGATGGPGGAGGAGGAIAASLDAFLADLRATPPAPGHDAVAVPGDRARTVRERHLRDGVPVAVATWARVQEIADEVTAVAARPASGDRPAPRRDED